MRKFAPTAALVSLALALAACGGGGSALDGSSTGTGGTGATGGTGGTGGTTGKTTTYEMGNGSGSSFQNGQIGGLPSSPLSAGGTASLTVTVVDQTGALYAGQQVTVTFSSSCISQGLAVIAASGGSTAGSTANTVNTTTGSVSATYTAKGCSGSDIITASATVASQALSATGTLSVAAATVGSIQFVSATPTSIGLKGTGLTETSTVVFKVVDQTGGARPGVNVSFSLNSTVGGMSLSPATATSAADGTVQTVVSSGTQHTSVRVTASIASPALSTQSSLLTVTTGLPASAGFSISVGSPSYGGQACPNIEAYGIDGQTAPITVRLADRYNNPAPDGTAVAFFTTGGHIAGNCTTPSAPGAADGTCSATWTSADPRPTPSTAEPSKSKLAGRVVVLATAIGEESFTDTNGNGYWDVGEPFSDLGEPYDDANENGAYDSGEYFLDFNKDGVRNAGDGQFKGIVCSGSPVSCSTSTLAISNSELLVMSTSGATIAPNPTSLTITRPSSGSPPVYSAGSGSVTFNVQDLNGNPVAAGTTITVVADSAIGSISASSSSFTVGCSTQIGGQSFTSYLTTGTTAGSGNITITVTAPSSKTISTIVVPVTVN